MRSIIAMALVAGLIAVPSSALSNKALLTESTITKSAPVIIKSLTDYPGRVRDVTDTQKAEIRAVLDQLDGTPSSFAQEPELPITPMA